jgi:hypothetical protein
LGIIADADYVSGGGFQQRWETLTEGAYLIIQMVYQVSVYG